ncbi:MAG: ArnT family glycosyltransferase [Alphaproteobacteria bacterium]
MSSPEAASGRPAWLRSPAQRTMETIRASRFWLPCALIALLGVFVIADTYDVFSATWDEPAHIAGGMELLDNGTYDYEPLHPPFGRMATALGPRLAGIEHAGEADIWSEGRNLLYEQGDYWQTLTLARVGVLPFFVLAALMTGLTARRFFGDAAGVGAVALFVATPFLLGLSGLAITDMTVTAFYLAAVLAFLRWLETGRHRDAALLGLAAGLAVMSKYSAIPWLVLTFGAILLLRWRLGGESPFRILKVRRLRLGFDLSLVALVLTLWAAHGFLFANVDVAGRATAKFSGDNAATETGAPRAWNDESGIPLPLFMKSVSDGIGMVLAHNAEGKETYFLGEWRDKPHPLFFPVTLGVKLPLPLLVLGLAGLGLTVWHGIRRRQWTALVPATAFALILALGMLSNLNYGLRHVLPALPLLCIMAAGGAMIALSALSAYGRLAQAGAAGLIGALFLWQAAGTARAHPDHLAWFNELAGEKPEEILVLGDLDWGQDLHRLSAELKRLGVARFHLLYIGSGLPQRHGLPPFEPLDPEGGPVSGWVVTHLRASVMFPEELRWLSEHEPVARAGETYRIYYVSPEGERAERRE